MGDRDPKGSRDRAEAKFNKAQKTTDEAKSAIDAERQATRTKMARLKEERLAKRPRRAEASSTKNRGQRSPGANEKPIVTDALTAFAEALQSIGITPDEVEVSLPLERWQRLGRVLDDE